jgi:hypothetical protein
LVSDAHGQLQQELLYLLQTWSALFFDCCILSSCIAPAQESLKVLQRLSTVADCVLFLHGKFRHGAIKAIHQKEGIVAKAFITAP